MGLDFEYQAGQTPLEDEEKDGLLLEGVHSKFELDEFEQHNIRSAVQWTMHRKFRQEEILSELFIKKVHEKMFGNVWSWAGNFRLSHKNMGCHPAKISVEIRQLTDDCNYWIAHKAYPEDEIAIRFKHRLVSIHPFSNGNGRHSRLMGDLLAIALNQPYFTWGANIKPLSRSRKLYLRTLKRADRGKIRALLQFARK